MLFLRRSVLLFSVVLIHSLWVDALPHTAVLNENQSTEVKNGCHQMIDSDQLITTVGDSTCSYDITPPKSTNTVLKSRGKAMLSCHKLKRLIQLFDVETGKRESICTDGEPGIYFHGTGRKYKLLIKPTGYEIPLKIAFEQTIFHCNEEVPSDALGKRLRLKFDENAGSSCAVLVPGGTVVELFPSKSDFFSEHPTMFQIYPNIDQYFGKKAVASAQDMLEGGAVSGGFVWCSAGVLKINRIRGHPAPDPIEFVIREITDEEFEELGPTRRAYNCQ